ncbi:PhoX family protein [Granulicoccus phenolivorans]|uniref:PhoX family protein n=1 Tax=Granulicoccus phenolivorans TaxID=266854 RepID=UPI000403501B|nr:PhoX family phosphatase [Granulicoccus phenolivorans]
MHDHDEMSNPSSNPLFADIVAARATRRGVLAGSLGVAALSFVAGAEAYAAPKKPNPGATKTADDLITFTNLAKDNGPLPKVAAEYEYQVLIPWREKLDGSGTSFDYNGFTAAQQEQAIGIGHDGMWLFTEGNDAGVLVVNHEYGENEHIYGAAQPVSLEQVRLSQAAHGVAVVKIAKQGGTWKVQADRRNRRITANTSVEFSGPAAKSAKLVTKIGANDPKGTLNNCAMGHTPWGTYLTCEENFHNYVGATGAWTQTAEHKRYGISAAGGGYDWFKFDDRFDIAKNPNEENRFGWVVEIDPNDPSKKPVKRTALGRFKHEGACVTVGRGQRVVVYSGDDERNEYIYKFVSAKNYKSMQAQGQSPLDEGVLYVAAFKADGTGEWLELSPKNPKLAGWTQEDILINTRIAADQAGATMMDRPEWITVGQGGEMFATLTNNTSPKAQDRPGNPSGSNPNGHIVKWHDADDHTGTTFEWDFFAIANDVKDEAGQMFGSPDGIWADGQGRVFVETDGSQPGKNNDHLFVAHQHTGEFRRLMTGVRGGEVTGITVSADQRTGFANIQHPGNGDPKVSNFPQVNQDGVTVPRDATLVIFRTDGGVFGS